MQDTATQEGPDSDLSPQALLMKEDAAEAMRQLMGEDDEPEEAEAEAPESTEEPEPAPAEEAESADYDDTEDDEDSPEAAAEDVGDSRTKELEGKLAKSEQRVKDAQRRMTEATQESAALRKSHMEAVSIIRSQEERIKALEAGTKVPDQPEPELDDDFVRDYPEAAKRLTEIKASSGSEVQKLQRELEAIQSAQTQKTRDESKYAILAAHPDAIDLVSGPEIWEWIGQHPLGKTYENILRNNIFDVRGNVAILAEFKRATAGETPPPKNDTSRERVAKVKAVESPPIRSRARQPESTQSKGRVWKSSEISALSLADYEKHKKDIDKALHEGRITDG